VKEFEEINRKLDILASKKTVLHILDTQVTYFRGTTNIVERHVMRLSA
jgi:hypothetical protein